MDKQQQTDRVEYGANGVDQYYINAKGDTVGKYIYTPSSSEVE